MIKKNIFSLAAIVITLSVTVACLTVWRNEGLPEGARLENVILIATCAIQTIATLFILQNNIIARNAYLRALEPSLLIKVQYADIYKTTISYSNTTDNPFTDLSIRCNLMIDNRIIPCKNLFPDKMYMGPRDSCVKSLYVMEYFSGQSISFNDLLGRLKLEVSFIYTFQDRRREFKIQDHRLVEHPTNHAEWVVI